MDVVKAERNEKLFREYRELTAKKASIVLEIEALQDEINRKHDKHRNIVKECDIMRKIITAVIEDDADPTEIKLKGPETLSSDLWSTDITYNPSDMITLNTLMPSGPNWFNNVVTKI